MPTHTFLRRSAWLIVAGCLITTGAVYSQTSKDSQTLSWHSQIAGDDEPGTRLVVSGTVYKADGKTPAPGVKIEAYHTDANGLYAPRSAPWGTIRLKGHVTTDDKGRYLFRTIRPGSYPSGDAPEHIHYKLTGPGVVGDGYHDLEFADDPRVPASRTEKERRRGKFASIVATTTDDDGVEYAEFNIKLESR